MLNADYKISQCHDVVETATGMRDTSAAVELTHKPINIVSLDFTSAFDRISHYYIQHSQGPYDLDYHTIQLITSFCNNMSFRCKINEYLSPSIPIYYSILQSRPLSMIAYTLMLNPLLTVLDQELTSIRMGQDSVKVTLVANAET